MNVSEYTSIFQGRQKVFAIQIGKEDQHEWSKKYGIGTYVPIRRNITTSDYRKHFNGEVTLGIYVVDENDNCAFTAIDLDEKNLDYLNALLSACSQVGLSEDNVLIEFSGKKGYHIFIPFQRRISAKKAKALGQIIRALSKVRVEVFPKQITTNKKKGLGSLIKLPLGKHKESGVKTYFLDHSFERLSIKDVKVTKVNKEKINGIIEKYSYIIPKESENTNSSNGSKNLICIETMSKGVKKGHINDSLFTLAAYFKQKGDLIGLTKKDCLKYILEWNKKNTPPADVETVEAKVDGVYSGEYFIPGCSSDQLSPFCDARCWKYPIVYGTKEESSISKLSIYDCIPEEGLIRDYIDYASFRNKAPVEYHLMTILSLLSTIVGDNIWFDLFDDGRKIPNLYTLLVGTSGIGKGSAINMGINFACRVSNGLLIPSDFLSREALIDSLIHFPSGLLVLEEFSSLLAKSKNSRYAGVTELLREIYDSRGDYRTSSKGEGPKTIPNPRLSILAAIVPEEFSSSISYKDIYNGFLCRYLFVCSTTEVENREYRKTTEEHIKRKDRIEYSLSSYLDMPKREADLSEVMSNISDFIYNNKLDIVNDPQEHILKGYWNRLEAYITKLAILYQVSFNGSNKVESKSFDYAYNLVDYLKGQVRYIIKNILVMGEGYAIADRVCKIIEKPGRYGIKRGELHRLSGINDLRKFDRVIETLVDQEMIFFRFFGAKKKSNMQFYDSKFKQLFKNEGKNA